MTISDNKALDLSSLSMRAALAVGENAFDAQNNETQWREMLEDALKGLSISKLHEVSRLFDAARGAKTRNSFADQTSYQGK